MPAWILSAEPTHVTPFDVLAQGSGGSDLMVHALLFYEESARTDVVKGALLKCVHMGPPFSQRDRQVDAVGTAVLTDEDIRKIKTFADDRLRERKAEEERLKRIKQEDSLRVEYCIHHPSQKPTAIFSLWRFSCVGFVLQAYRTARIELPGTPLPLRTLDELKQFYPTHAAKLDDPETRKQLGIDQGDSWPVALVGYVLHSLSRQPTEIRGTPHAPKSGDEYFPRRERTGAAAPAS